MTSRIVTLLALLCLASPALAQTRQDLWDRCKSNDNHDLAIGACTALIQSGTETDVNLAILFMNRGVSYNAKGEPDLAIKDYEMALSLDRTNPNIYYNRARVFITRKDFDAALRDADRTQQARPGYALAHLIRAEVSRRNGRFADAGQEFDMAISAGIDDAVIGGLAKEARAANEQAKRCGDAQVDLSIGACSAIIADGTMTAAAVANAYNTRAIAHGRKDNWEQVLRDHNESIRLNGASAVFFANRAVAYMRLGNYEEAAKDFDRSLALDPKSPAAINGQGLTARQQRDYARAIERFTVAIVYVPESATDTTASYIGNRGMTYVLMEKYGEALTDLNRALSINPKSAFALFSRGVLKIRNGDAAAGEADIAAATAIQSDIEAFMAKRHLTR